MRLVEELSTQEYIDTVIAAGEVDDFEKYCEEHDIDYEDAKWYEWSGYEG